MSAPELLGERTRKRPRRTVLIIASAAIVVVGVLVAIIASAPPAASVDSRSQLLGKHAPAVSGPGLEGGHFRLAGFRGEWVLVNFMASWCVPCQEEMPQLAAFQAEHASAHDATILGVEYDQSDLGNLTSFLRQHHAAWPVVNDSMAKVAYGVSGIPESYLVSPNGVVTAKFFGGITAAKLDAAIASSMASGAG